MLEPLTWAGMRSVRSWFSLAWENPELAQLSAVETKTLLPAEVVDLRVMSMS